MIAVVVRGGGGDGVAQRDRLLVCVEPLRSARAKAQQEEIPHAEPDTPTIKKLPPQI
jgi:hypothetical protein